MGDNHLSPHQATMYTPPPSARSTNVHMLYYGLVVIGTASIVLALYNLIIIRWCADFATNGARQRPVHGPRSTWRWRFHDSSDGLNSISSFKYKKEGVGEDEEDEYNQCAVCLSVFEEGEEVKQLPKCKHSFHAPCIDMWLYSHLDCPLCRTPVEPPPVLQHNTVTQPSEHSREVLLGQGATLV